MKPNFLSPMSSSMPSKGSRPGCPPPSSLLPPPLFFLRRRPRRLPPSSLLFCGRSFWRSSRLPRERLPSPEASPPCRSLPPRLRRGAVAVVLAAVRLILGVVARGLGHLGVVARRDGLVLGLAARALAARRLLGVSAAGVLAAGVSRRVGRLARGVRFGFLARALGLLVRLWRLGVRLGLLDEQRLGFSSASEASASGASAFLRERRAGFSCEAAPVVRSTVFTRERVFLGASVSASRASPWASPLGEVGAPWSTSTFDSRASSAGRSVSSAM